MCYDIVSTESLCLCLVAIKFPVKSCLLRSQAHTTLFIYLFMLASMCLICVVFSVIVGDSSRHCDTGLINLTTSYSVIINRFCQRTNTRDLRDLQRSAVALLSQL